MWYPENWQPGVNGADDYRPRGVGVELRGGGPLDGRQGHVYNALEALWVAGATGRDVIVASAREEPTDLPSGYVLKGRYVLNVSDRALHWHPLDDSGVLLSPEGGHQRPVMAGAARTSREVPRLRFGPLWAERETPPSPILRLWRRLSSLLRPD